LDRVLENPKQAVTQRAIPNLGTVGTMPVDNW
jgi:hypothetical protein